MTNKLINSEDINDTNNKITRKIHKDRVKFVIKDDIEPLYDFYKNGDIVPQIILRDYGEYNKNNKSEFKKCKKNLKSGNDTKLKNEY